MWSASNAFRLNYVRVACHMFVTFAGLHQTARIHRNRVAAETYGRRVLVSGVRSGMFCCGGSVAATPKFGSVKAITFDCFIFK